jgi:maleylacetate reductase
MRMATFDYTSFAQQVIFGEGSLDRLGEATERFGWRRMMLCVTSHARARGQVAQVEAALGARLAVIFEGVTPHVPEGVVAEATELATRADVDAIIGLGGGSAIGAAKATASALHAATHAAIPVVAIPTTYAGSEMTPVFGVTRLVDGESRKVTVREPGVAPRLVLYDPLLTLDLPPRETAGTGINAVAHCIEALYSITRNPVCGAVALAGLRAIAHALPAVYADGADREARAEMLVGAYLAGTALANVAMGLHHGVCHVIGGATGAAHGDVNSVMLAHVIRFNLGGPDGVAPELAQTAEAMGVTVSGRDQRAAAGDAAERVAEWVEQMGLPARLREIGVREEQLPALARVAFASRTVQNNPRPITDVAQLDALLRAAW